MAAKKNTQILKIGIIVDEYGAYAYDLDDDEYAFKNDHGSDVKRYIIEAEVPKLSANNKPKYDTYQIKVDC